MIDHHHTQTVFSTRPPNSRGVILASKTEEEPRPSRKATARPRVGYPKELEQVTHAHAFLNTLIMNWKSTLVNQITYLTVEHLHQPDLPQAGRLTHHLTNWSAITQNQWVLSTVQGYQINFVALPHQESLPTPPHYISEQVTLIQEEVSKLLLK